jgi:integrase
MQSIYDEFKIRDGKVLIYRRGDSNKHWNCRIKFPGKPYVRRSLKTESREEAKRLAGELYDELSYKKKRGLSVSSRKFRGVCDAYIKDLEKKVKLGSAAPKRLKDYKRIIESYLKPYFGGKDTDKISDADLHKYRDWREAFWITGKGAETQYIEYERNGKTIRAPKKKAMRPSARTLGIEDTVLRQVFDFARKTGYVSAEEVPVIKSKRAKANRRPAFTLDEYKVLWRASLKRYKKASREWVRNQRQLLHDYILIMVNSGMRPVEAATLRWRDVVRFDGNDGKEYIKLSVRGKKKRRDLVPMPRVKQYLERIRRRQQEFANRYDYVVEDSSPVFSDREGRAVSNFKKSFDELLKATDLTYDNHGAKRSIYSLRHTYATFRLVLGDVNVYELAQNMGTSVEMIERHYGHLQPEQVADRLTRIEKR